jgi:hypothetical protein
MPSPPMSRTVWNTWTPSPVSQTDSEGLDTVSNVSDAFGTLGRRFQCLTRIFVAEEITFSFCNPMVIHGQPLPTIPRLLLSEQTCLDKSRYPEFSDGVNCHSRIPNRRQGGEVLLNISSNI